MVRIERSSSSCSRTTHLVSHHGAAPPTTNELRRRHGRPAGRRPALFLSIFIVLTCCLSFSSAYYIKEEMVEDIDSSGADDSDILGSAFAALAKTGTIVIDQRPPPVPGSWRLASEEESIMVKRHDAATDTTSTTSHTASMTSTPSTTSTASTTSASQTSSPLPSLFDSGYSSNITTTCANFFTDFLSNSTFKSCYPFSLLLQVSSIPTADSFVVSK